MVTRSGGPYTQFRGKRYIIEAPGVTTKKEAVSKKNKIAKEMTDRTVSIKHIKDTGKYFVVSRKKSRR